LKPEDVNEKITGLLQAHAKNDDSSPDAEENLVNPPRQPKSPILPSGGSGIASSSTSATGGTPLPTKLSSENQIVIDPNHSCDFAYGTHVQNTPLANPLTPTEPSVYMHLSASMGNPFDVGYRPVDISGAHNSHQPHQSMTSLLNDPLDQNIDDNGLWNGLPALPGFDSNTYDWGSFGDLVMANPGQEEISLLQTGKRLGTEIDLPSMQLTLPKNTHAGFSGPPVASMSSVWNGSTQDDFSGLHTEPTQHVQHLAAPNFPAQEELIVPPLPIQPSTAQELPSQQMSPTPAPPVQPATAEDLPGQQMIFAPAPSIQPATAQDLPGQQIIPTPAPPVQPATPQDSPAGINIAPAPTLTIQPAADVSMQNGTMAAPEIDASAPAGQPNTTSILEKRSRKPPVARGEIVPLTEKPATEKDTTTTPPGWFTAAQTYLKDLDVEDWKACLESWINLENAIGLSEVSSVCYILIVQGKILLITYVSSIV